MKTIHKTISTLQVETVSSIEGTYCVNDWHLTVPSLILTPIHISTPSKNTELTKDSEHEDDSEVESDVLLSEPELKEPPKYAVIMYNDNYTPMDFVVFVLMSEFRHSQDEAVQIMLDIHQQGKGIAGIYIKDIAETKANKVNSTARHEGFPLMTKIEPYKE